MIPPEPIRAKSEVPRQIFLHQEFCKLGSVIFVSPSVSPTRFVPVARQGAISIALYSLDFFGTPNRIRTCDLLIKSQLLYQLSYGRAEPVT